MTVRCERFGMRKNPNGGSQRLILWLLLQKALAHVCTGVL